MANPWRTHRGDGCPCKGWFVTIQRRSGEIFGPYTAGSLKRCLDGSPKLLTEEERTTLPCNWSWAKPGRKKGKTDIVAYRVERPKAIEDLLEKINHPVQNRLSLILQET